MDELIVTAASTGLVLAMLLVPAVFVAALVPAAILIYLTWAAYHGVVAIGRWIRPQRPSNR